MNSHNTRPGLPRHKTAPTHAKVVDGAKPEKRALTQQVELSLDENFDHGSDPYNSTGQHVVLKPSEP